MLRREFIVLASATLASLSMGLTGCGKQNVAASYPVLPTDVCTKSPTFCEMCFWKCSGWVHSKNGKPWKVTGNEQDQHCLGRLCTRGSGGLGAYEDNDRLKTPMIRITNSDGSQGFREASWDEALNYIAEKLATVKGEYGAESLALFSHGYGATHWKTFTKAFGSQNITAPSYAQCRGPRTEAFKATFGQGVGSPECTDMENSQCIVLIGSHIGENLHNTQVQELGTALKNGCELIVVDPRQSVAATKAEHWLPIKPSTDIALLLSWIHVLLEENIFNQDFVTEHCTGLEELKKECASYTPEWAYPITSIQPDVIRKTARTMAKNAPATLVHPGRHVTWYGDDTQRSRCIAILNALLGSWGSKGGLYLPQKAKVPKYPLPAFSKPKWTWKDLENNKYQLASAAVASQVRDVTADPSLDPEHPIKAWFVYGSNLMMSLPEQKKTIQAIQNLDLLVAVDIMPAEICGWADVILPECTYLERYDDIRVSPGRKRQIAVRAPAFEPRFDSKPSSWIVKQLAQKCGLDAWFPWANQEEYLSKRLEPLGISLKELEAAGVMEVGQQQPLYFADGAPPTFKTASGKVELVSSLFSHAGFDAVPRYTRHPEPPQGYARLLMGRSPMHTFSRTTNNPHLCQLKDENELWMHPDLAMLWGVTHGQRIALENQDGEQSRYRIPVKVTQRIRPDCVYMVHGFGHSEKKMTRAFGKGIAENELMTTIHIDPIMGGTGRRGNFVVPSALTRTEAAHQQEVGHA